MIITNDENIKPIYKFKNKNKRSRFPRAGIIIAVEFVMFGVSSSTLKANQNPSQFVNISKENETPIKQTLSIEKDDSGLFKANQLTRITNEVGEMSEVTQNDLKDTERHFDERLDKRFDKLNDKIDLEQNDIKEIKQQFSKLSIDVEGMRKDIKNMPNQIKVEKYDNFKEKYEAPIITGIIVGVVLILAKIFLHV